MGTNFYTLQGKHLGKRSAAGSSFTWAVLKSELRRLKYVKDEYGRKMTKEEFCKMLEECPIQFFDHIGVEFS